MQARDTNELLLDALAAAIFEVGVESNLDIPELAKLPTDTIKALHERLMDKGLDSIGASCTLLNKCQEDFQSSTIKFLASDLGMEREN